MLGGDLFEYSVHQHSVTKLKTMHKLADTFLSAGGTTFFSSVQKNQNRSKKWCLV